MKIGKLSFVDPDGKQAILSSTAVYIEINGQYAGAVTFVDHIRPEATADNECTPQNGSY